nr:DExH-box ATP-dependent RNA helicase DExH12-like [Ipomoea trifida]
MQMGGGSQDDMIQEADEDMALNVQDIDAYWLRFLRSSDLRIVSLDLAVILSPHFIHPLPPSTLPYSSRPSGQSYIPSNII